MDRDLGCRENLRHRRLKRQSGERAGRLPEVMQRIADFSRDELDESVARVTTFIEPLMIVFMGIVIGGVATALLLPIFDMGKVMSGH